MKTTNLLIMRVLLKTPAITFNTSLCLRASLLNTVVERTEGMNDAWEHFASADPAFANVASYRLSSKDSLVLLSYHIFVGTQIRLVLREE